MSIYSGLFVASLTPAFQLASVEVGQHWYWQLGQFQVHAQVLITSWVVAALLLGLAVWGTRSLKAVPQGGQGLVEYVLEFIRDLTRTQIGEEEYRPWVPFIGTLFLFILYPIGQGHLYLGKLLNYLMESLPLPQTILILL